LVEQVTGIEPV